MNKDDLHWWRYLSGHTTSHTGEGAAFTPWTPLWASEIDLICDLYILHATLQTLLNPLLRHVDENIYLTWEKRLKLYYQESVKQKKRKEKSTFIFYELPWKKHREDLMLTRTSKKIYVLMLHKHNEWWFICIKLFYEPISSYVHAYISLQHLSSRNADKTSNSSSHISCR